MPLAAPVLPLRKDVTAGAETLPVPADLILRYELRLQGLAHGVARRMAGDIEAAYRRVVQQLAAAPDATDPWTEPRLRSMATELAALRAALAKTLGKATDELVEGVVVTANPAVEGALRTLEPIAAALGVGDFEVTFAAVPVEQLAQVLKPGFAGRTWAQWSTKLADDTIERITTAVSRGLAEGQGIPEMAKAIEDATALSQSYAKTLAVTATSAAANAAKTEIYRANSGPNGVLAGVEFVATLDGRTCLVAGTPVLTPRGYRPIETIQLGDKVIGGTGEPRMVEAVIEARTRRLMRVRLSSGETITCTPDHRFLLVDQRWLEAQQLARRMILAGRQQDDRPVSAHRLRGRKLGPDQVRAIRTRAAVGASMRTLAGEYRMSLASIYNVISRRTYRDVR